jgi:hypothetical protein
MLTAVQRKKNNPPPHTNRPASVELKVQGVGTVFAIGGARLQKKSAYTDNCEKNL